MSVILPVFNGSKTVIRSVTSILDQIGVSFELLIVDDGSSDNSAEIIRGFVDPRIRKFFNESNLGLAATLDFALTHSRGKYIARQDQDDFSLPLRLHEQVEFLENHSDTVLVGSWARVLGDSEDIGLSRSTVTLRHPLGDQALRWRLLFSNPFVHTSIIMRKASVCLVGGYAPNKENPIPEDYYLWSRLSTQGKLANLKVPLVDYHESVGGMSRNYLQEIQSGVVEVATFNLKALGINEPDRLETWKYVVTTLNGFRRDPETFRVLLISLWMLTKTAHVVGGLTPSFELIAQWFFSCGRLISLWLKSRRSPALIEGTVS